MQNTKQQLEELITQIPEKWQAKAIETLLSFMVDQMENESKSSTKPLSLETQNTKLKEEIKKLQKEKEELTKSITELVEENEISTKKAREQEKKIKEELQKTIEKMKQENFSLNYLVDTLTKENDVLRKTTESSRATKSSETEILNKKLQIEVDSLHKLIKANETEFNQKLAESNYKIQKLENDLKKAVSERDSIIQALETTQQKLEELEKSKSLGTGSNELIKKIEELKQTNESLTVREKKIKLTLEEMVKKNADLIDAQDKFEVTIEKLKKEIQTEKSHNEKERVNLQKLIESLALENERLQDSSKKDNFEGKTLTNKLIELEKGKASLLSENKMLTKSVEELKKRLSLEESGYDIIA